MSVHVNNSSSSLSLTVNTSDGHHWLMKRWPEEIIPLPPRTRSILRSTVILTSLVQVVSELIQNSLDANARSIQVGIDCSEWSCWVQDDGTGFTIDDLESLANNCKADSMRYSTSKVSDRDHVSFGFRGEGEPRPVRTSVAWDLDLSLDCITLALASIADLSVLEVSSRTARARQSWSTILKVRTRDIARCRKLTYSAQGTDALYFGPSVRWQRQSAGTTVCVRDAFHNVRVPHSSSRTRFTSDVKLQLPVRRLAHTPSARTLELIRREIETYALVFPNVTFQLKHSRTQEKIMAISRVRFRFYDSQHSLTSTSRHPLRSTLFAVYLGGR